MNKLLMLFFGFLAIAGKTYGQYDWPMVNRCKERTSWAKNETYLYPPFDSAYSYQVSAEVLVFSDQTLFVGVPSTPNQIKALDFESGNEVWSFDIPNTGGSISCVPAVSDSIILCGGQGGLGLYALDRFTGEQKWLKNIGNLYSKNPVLDSKRVYIIADSLYCLSLKSGATLWTYWIGGELTPAVDDSNVYVAAYSQIHVLNKLTGELKWQVTNYGSEALAVDNQYIYVRHSDSLVARRKTDGQIHWSYPIPDGYLPGLNQGAVAISDSFLCFVIWENSESKGQLYTLNKLTGNYLWHHTFDTTGAYTPSIANGVVYVVEWNLRAGKLWGFDLKTGNTLFFDDSESYTGQPIIANHTLFVAAAGKVKAFRNSNVSVEEIASKTSAAAYFLTQNYPNPFNQITTISYRLPIDCHVHLAVYNVLGQLVETLVDTRQSTGTHSAVWAAHEVSPGLYFYKLTIGRTSKVKKCLVLK